MTRRCTRRGAAIIASAWTVLAGLAWLVGLGVVGSAAERIAPLVALGPAQWVPRTESAEEAAARDALLGARTGRTCVILHRGAWQVVPENTFAAFNAALDLGADGWEFDIDRTRDGVLVVFHDGAIDRLLDGTGLVKDMYYEELMLYPFRGEPAAGPPRFWVPTLAETLALVRERGALLYFDIKNPEAVRDVIAMIDAADMWHYVVGEIKDPTAPASLVAERPYRRLGETGWLIFDSHEITNAEDGDLQTVREVLAANPGLVIADDPRIVLEALGRPIGQVKPQPPREATPVTRAPNLESLLNSVFGLNPWLDGRLAAARLINYYGGSASAEVGKRFQRGLPYAARINIAWALGMAARYYPDHVTPDGRDVLLTLARDPEADVRAEAARALGFCARAEDVPVLVALASEGQKDARLYPREVAERSRHAALTRVRRAAADALGRVTATPAAIEALTHIVQRPSTDWPSDGAAAAHSLGQLGAQQSLGALRALLISDSSDLLKVNPWLAAEGPQDVSSWDSESRTVAAEAIAAIGDPDALAFLSSLFTKPVEGKDDKEKERSGWRWTWELIPAVDALAQRDDAPAREACAQALFSPLGKVRREAFFRLWGARGPEACADAVARAVTRRLEQGKDLTGCATALHLLGYLGHRSPEVEAAVAKGQAATDQTVRDRAAWAAARLRETPK